MLKTQSIVILFLSLLLLDTTLADITINEIPPLQDQSSSKAFGINNNGIVCGKSYTTDEDDIALIWDKSTGTISLPPLFTLSESVAWDINDSGQISGFSRNDAGNMRAVRWNDATTIVDIGTLMNKDTNIYGDESDGYDIADNGMVVGHADIPNDTNDFTPLPLMAIQCRI